MVKILRLDNKPKPTLYCLQVKHIKSKNSDVFKVKGWKKIEP